MSPSTTQSAGSVPVQTGQEHVVIPPSFRDVLPGSAQGAIPGSTHDAMRGSTQGTTPVSTLGVIPGSTQYIQYDQQSLVDSITAKVLQVIQSESQPLAFNTQRTTSMGVADAITVPEVTTVDTAQMVSDALQTLISGDRGEAGELPMNLPKPCLSLSNPLGATLPPALKAKICADEFVNLSCLLDTNQEEDISVTWKKYGGNPTISLSNASKRDIVSIEQWTRAILVLAAVYTEKKPTQAPALFKYISLIRDMSYQRKDWTFYDDQFRRLKATSGVSWADINWELYFRSANIRNQQYQNQPLRPITYSSNNDNTSGRSSWIPKGYCFNYHNANSYTRQRCQFKHECFSCHNGIHSYKKCRSAKPKTSASAPKPTQ